MVRTLPDARFVILGEGELRAALEHQVKHLHLEQHVVLAGFRTDVLALLKGLDLFVMSSVTEGLGTSLLDAMAASRPIVATTAGGIPEVVESTAQTGVLVPPRDPPALADGIIALLQDDERRRRMGEAGFARAQEMFSVERMVAETLKVYEGLPGPRVGFPTGSGSNRRPGGPSWLTRRARRAWSLEGPRVGEPTADSPLRGQRESP